MKVDTEETRPSIRGFRFCDMKVLSPIFSVLPCGKCGNFSLLLKEDNETEGMCINFAFAVQAVWMETFILHIKEARKEFWSKLAICLWHENSWKGLCWCKEILHNWGHASNSNWESFPQPLEHNQRSHESDWKGNNEKGGIRSLISQEG